MDRGAPVERYNERYNGIIEKYIYILVYLSLNSIVSLIVSLGQLPPSRHSFPLAMCSSSLFPLTSLLNVWGEGGPGERSGLRGCAAAKRGLPKRSPPEAVLPRSGPLPMLCGPSDAPLSQRSSAVAVICRSNGSWTETERRKFVCVRICKLPRRSGTSARGGNNKRDFTKLCPRPTRSHPDTSTTAH